MIDTFMHELKKLENKKTFTIMKATWVDLFWKGYILVAFVYYVADCIYCAQNYDLTQEYCILGMFLHHVATIFAIMPALFIPHYPWFFTFVFAFHCFLIAFPYNKILHAPYATGLIFMLIRFFTRPFFQMKLYRQIITFLPLLTVALLTIAYNKCDQNDLRY